MARNYKKYEGKGALHKGPDNMSPYPVSRLSPAIELVDLAREIEQADQLVNVRASAKLKVVADQIRSLQAEARAILDEAKHDQDLHHVPCSFKKSLATYTTFTRKTMTADTSRCFLLMTGKAKRRIISWVLFI